MSVQEKYAIVYFVHEAKVEVVPSSWLIKNAAVKWPTNSTSIALMSKYIKELRKPEESWDVIPVRVLGFAKSFGAANQQAYVAQDTSNTETDSSQENYVSQDTSDIERDSSQENYVAQDTSDIERDSSQENYVAQDTSDIETDSSQEKVVRPSKKRVRPARYDSLTDDELQIPKNVNKKINRTPNPPSLRDLNSSTPKSQLRKESLSASLISSPSASRSSVKGNAVCTILNSIFKCLENIQKDVQSLKAEQAKIQLQLDEISNKEAPGKYSYMLPDGISIPVVTDEQLVGLNLHLKEDRDLSAALARYLHETTLGKSLYVFLLNVTKKVLTRHVANSYSRLGRKGKKSFEAVDEVYSCILAAAAIKFSHLSKEEIADKFGRVLASANDWDRCRIHTKLQLMVKEEH